MKKVFGVAGVALVLAALLTIVFGSTAIADQTQFAWEVSADGVNWSPVTLPHTNFGCSFCTRYYRTFVEGVPSAVSFRFGSDNEARMFVNGNVVFDDYYVTGVDFCTTQSCCALCCDTPANCNNVIAGQVPFTLSPAELANFVPGTNEIRWQVNQQTGGSGFYTQMTVSFPPPECVAPPPDMAGWWPGDGNADDIVGSNDGTLMNGAAFAAGKVDQAFSFDGVNDFVQIPNAALNNMPAGTIDMWIFPTANGVSAWYGSAWFAKQHNNVNSYTVFAFKSPTDSRVLFHLRNPFTTDVVGTTPLTLNTWHHVAATWDGSFIRLYVDGVNEGQVASTLGLPSDLASVTSIGAWTGDGNSFFKGLIDEVEIFDRALSAEEIQAIFLAGSAGKCKNEPPVAQCQNVTVSAGNSCNAAASVDNGSYDPDGDEISVSQSPAGPYGLGQTQVTLTVTDTKGASDSCQATVTVNDVTPPAISCPAPQVAECTGNGSANVTVGSATASDNCNVALTSCTLGSGSYPLGTTSGTCTATDGSGNSSQCTTSVTVVDTIAPTVSCVASVNPSGKNVPKASNTNQDGFYRVGASDICSTPVIKIGSYTLANGETIKITQTPGKSGVTYVNTMGPEQIRHFQVGPGDAVITATDGSGNQTSVTCLVPPPPK